MKKKEKYDEWEEKKNFDKANIDILDGIPFTSAR
jgi:hypothetical protein